MPKKKQAAVTFVQMPVGTPEAPPILDVCAQFLFLVLQPRLRYPLKEAAILLAISLLNS
jgi:hypothetical protein